jgi:hypothetical protein
MVKILTVIKSSKILNHGKLTRCIECAVFDIFEQIEHNQPATVSKLNSKTLTSDLMCQNISKYFHSMWISKDAEFDAGCKSLEKDAKSSCEKLPMEK